jgi:hypothetical protein
MHLIYYGGGGILDLHGLPPLISWIVIVGGFLGCIAFLSAWGFRRDQAALRERVRKLEDELARIAPRELATPPR